HPASHRYRRPAPSPLHPRPPRPTLSPYTTLFRSVHDVKVRPADATGVHPEQQLAGTGLRDRHLLLPQRCSGPVQDHRPHSSQSRSEEHTSELQSPDHLVCRLLLEKKKKETNQAKP